MESCSQGIRGTFHTRSRIQFTQFKLELGVWESFLFIDYAYICDQFHFWVIYMLDCVPRTNQNFQQNMLFSSKVFPCLMLSYCLSTKSRSSFTSLALASRSSDSSKFWILMCNQISHFTNHLSRFSPHFSYYFQFLLYFTNWT